MCSDSTENRGSPSFCWSYSPVSSCCGAFHPPGTAQNKSLNCKKELGVSTTPFQWDSPGLWSLRGHKAHPLEKKLQEDVGAQMWLQTHQKLLQEGFPGGAAVLRFLQP